MRTICSSVNRFFMGFSLMKNQKRTHHQTGYMFGLRSGRLIRGAAAFLALCLTMPGWRELGRLSSLLDVTPVLESTYRGFLHFRPILQRWIRAT